MSLYEPVPQDITLFRKRKNEKGAIGDGKQILKISKSQKIMDLFD